ncbi:MAG: UDP-glucose 6-dehydrogenase [Nanoarchaeota archaeon]|nr:UDP-glucose 6-dehydrogenase [Nanoarchaeota archaeon]
MKITVFGTGYVGLTTGACLANLGHNVLCVDIDENKINQLREGNIPFYEPRLPQLVQTNTSKGRLTFTTNIEEGVQFANVIFNCVGTPSRKDGSADLQYVFDVAQQIALFATQPTLLINKSTVPPGTAKKCDDIIKEVNPATMIEVVSNPEFLAEGKAVHDFNHPDKIVVGAKTSRAFSILRKVYTGRVRTYIPVLETDWETAETIKYANNAFLATKISFINEIANICDKVGADVRLIAQAMGLDKRISPKHLNPGVGYGGSCFPKDVRALIATANEHNYQAGLLKEVDQLNERQKLTLFDKVKEKYPDFNGKTFTVWGLSFKPKTSDTREAPSLTLISQLLQHGANVQVYDPIASEEAKKTLGDSVTFCDSLASSVEGSSAIFLKTEWDEFKHAPFDELGKSMKEKIIFDGRNIFEPELIREEGFEYVGVGRK